MWEVWEMNEEKKGKYIVRWHGVKDENDRMYSPDQLPKDMVDLIIDVILEETAITRSNSDIN